MKKIIIFSIAFLVGMVLALQSVYAQSNDTSDKTVRQLSINVNGEVLDNLGTKLGYVDKKNMVFDSQGTKLGYIKGGKVFDGDGNPMGRVEKGGRYYNNDGVFVLETKDMGEKCEILDPEGHSRGNVHKNYKMHACVTHCFFKDAQMQNGDE